MSATVAVGSPAGPLLRRGERISLAIQLTLALAAACLLAVAVGWRLLIPQDRALSDLVAGGAALLVAIPVSPRLGRACATRPARHHRPADRAGADGGVGQRRSGDGGDAADRHDLGHVLEERTLLGSQEAIRALSRSPQPMRAGCGRDGRSRKWTPRRCAPGTCRAARRRPGPGRRIVATRRGEPRHRVASPARSVPVEARPGAQVAGRRDQHRWPADPHHPGRQQTTLGRDHRADARGGGRQAADHAPARPPCQALPDPGAADRSRQLVRDRQYGGDAGGTGRLLPVRAGAGRPRDVGRGISVAAGTASYQGRGVSRAPGRRRPASCSTRPARITTGHPAPDRRAARADGVTPEQLRPVAGTPRRCQQPSGQPRPRGGLDARRAGGAHRDAGGGRLRSRPGPLFLPLSLLIYVSVCVSMCTIARECVHYVYVCVGGGGLLYLYIDINTCMCKW